MKLCLSSGVLSFSLNATTSRDFAPEITEANEQLSSLKEKFKLGFASNYPLYDLQSKDIAIELA